MNINTIYAEIAAAMEKASQTYLKGVLEVTSDEVVSTDFIHDSSSSVFDAGSGIDFNANFRGSDDNVTRDEIKEIVSGTINMRLYVVGPGGFRRTLDVSIPNAPIQNRVQ